MWPNYNRTGKKCKMQGLTKNRLRYKIRIDSRFDLQDYTLQQMMVHFNIQKMVQNVCTR